jgi:uncharacterized protein YcaQ
MLTPYSLSTLRTLALHAQGLTAASTGGSQTEAFDAIVNTVTRLGCVQIDTLQMVARSQYLVLWSRLGCYNPAEFDRLAYSSEQRCLFEGWMHAACLLPLCEYRYQIPHQRHLRQQPAQWSVKWLAEKGTTELLSSVLERVRLEGAVRTSDFEYHGPRRGSWWDWKPAKNALEHLYAWGDLMIAGRVNFQRVYDLTERVLPAWVDTTEPTIELRDRHWVEEGVRALGVCTPAQAADYTYRKQAIARPLITALIEEGILIPVGGRLSDGKTHDLLIHRDNLPILLQIAEGAIRAERTTFLSPFDSLWWAKRRDEQLWGFRQSLEAYKPAPQRIWGYFCLPILHGERLVGRFDPKLERQNGLLRIKALYLEQGIKPDDELLSGIATALRDFLAFHNAKDVLIERSQPARLGKKLVGMI